MRIIHKVVLTTAMLLVLSGCELLGWEHPGWERSTRTVEVEAGTGDTIITQYWQYGSRTTATYKRIPRGNTDRRGEPPSPLAPAD
jgi:hypothetical protein